MIVVTNSGPLIALSKLGIIEVAYACYGALLVPEAVRREVVDQGRALNREDATRVALAQSRGFLCVEAVDSIPSGLALGKLDAGEREAIVLASVRNADLVLLDEALARKIAKHEGLKVKGTVGIIVDAMRGGHITRPDVRALFDVIVADASIWISSQLVEDTWRALE